MPLSRSDDRFQERARVEPEDQMSYLVARGRGLDHPPSLGVILLYQRKTLEACRKKYNAKPIDRFRPPISIFDTPEGQIGFCGDFGMGGPAATILLELLIAGGVTRFFTIGSAGGMNEGLQSGDIVLCDEAIRDEGVSYHYVHPSQNVGADPQLLSSWRRALTAAGHDSRVGMSWTTDAPFRETLSDLEVYRTRGVLSVDMEAAAVYAVAQYRGVKLAAGFGISDLLTQSEWKPQFHYAATIEAQMKLVEAAVLVLRGQA